MSNDSLGDRMKTYEAVPKHFLMHRTPVIIRLDGKAFHTFTKKINTSNDPSLLDGPFSEKLHWVMTRTMVELCNNIQNAKIAYTQSDEISILLTDWDKLTTDQWFNGNIQKIASVSASIATAHFNHNWQLAFPITQGMAFFDSRVFNLPKEEVNNYFLWRQNDASRNSVQMLGHHFFSQKQMHGLNNSQVQDKLMLEKNINWNDVKTWMKRGSCFHSKYPTTSQIWLDEEIPIFSQDREYISRYVTEISNGATTNP